MSAPSWLGRLHVITDVELQTRFSHEELGQIARESGADSVQYRDKRPIDRDQHMRQVVGLLRVLDGMPLIVNDQVGVAHDSGAWGVHLGREDTPWEQARRRLGPHTRIGATANDLEQALVASVAPVDYLGVGPVFRTHSKNDPAPVLGLAGLRRIVDAVERPVIAIGGIRSKNIEEIFETGAHGVAILSAVVCNNDPGRELDEIRSRIDRIYDQSQDHVLTVEGEAP
jgi:thiamine-phosphate pyrophosphorylase